MNSIFTDLPRQHTDRVPRCIERARRSVAFPVFQPINFAYFQTRRNVRSDWLVQSSATLFEFHPFHLTVYFVAQVRVVKRMVYVSFKGRLKTIQREVVLSYWLLR